MKHRPVLISILLLLATTSLLWSARVLIFNPANGFIQDYRLSEEPSSFEGATNALIDPIVPPNFGNSNKFDFHVVDGSNVVELTAFEKQARDFAIASAQTNNTRALSSNAIGSFTAEQLRERATIDTLMFHLNVLRARINMGITNPPAFTNSTPFPMLTPQVLNFQIRQRIADGSVDQIPP